MSTTVNDLILVYIEENPAFFGRIEDITPDIKPGWWHVHIMVLSIPPRMISWILEDVQIQGKGFTMGGIPIRLEKVPSPYKEEDKGKEEDGKVISLGERQEEDKEEDGKVISLGERQEEDKEEEEKVISLGERQEEDKPQKNLESKVISLMDRRKK
ncbi:MAG: hypothetical protein ABRQ37_06925 [Candidatus Eremiobacterota bacterium]